MTRSTTFLLLSGAVALAAGVASGDTRVDLDCRTKVLKATAELEDDVQRCWQDHEDQEVRQACVVEAVARRQRDVIATLEVFVADGASLGGCSGGLCGNAAPIEECGAQIASATRAVADRPVARDKAVAKCQDKNRKALQDLALRLSKCAGRRRCVDTALLQARRKIAKELRRVTRKGFLLDACGGDACLNLTTPAGCAEVTVRAAVPPEALRPSLPPEAERCRRDATKLLEDFTDDVARCRDLQRDRGEGFDFDGCAKVVERRDELGEILRHLLEEIRRADACVDGCARTDSARDCARRAIDAILAAG